MTIGEDPYFFGLLDPAAPTGGFLDMNQPQLYCKVTSHPLRFFYR